MIGETRAAIAPKGRTPFDFLKNIHICTISISPDLKRENFGRKGVVSVEGGL